MVREALHYPDVELLSVSLCLFHLSREFPLIFITLVYIHLRANVENATWAIVETVYRLQCIADSPSLVMGDFSYVKPGRSLTFISMLHVLPET